MKLKYLFLSFVLIAFTGCDADLDSLEGMPIYVDIDSGDADFESMDVLEDHVGLLQHLISFILNFE